MGEKGVVELRPRGTVLGVGMRDVMVGGVVVSGRLVLVFWGGGQRVPCHFHGNLVIEIGPEPWTIWICQICRFGRRSVRAIPIGMSQSSAVEAKFRQSLKVNPGFFMRLLVSIKSYVKWFLNVDFHSNPQGFHALKRTEWIALVFIFLRLATFARRVREYSELAFNSSSSSSKVSSVKRRELSIQIAEQFKALGSSIGVKCAVVSLIVGIGWRTLLARDKLSATHGFFCAIKGHRVGAEHSSRPRVPEPKSYGGARDTKELENFLFDIEQYFRAIRVDSKATKVSMAAMYLIGDAKLWWQKKYAEIEDESCVINTWDILKRELKSQFFPENIAFNARKALLECKHIGSVREYCQAFFALMLDISDMSVVDRLFFFMEGLKPWARTELNRCRVNNLNEAIIAAESLSD
ncbi:hypothetical protein RJ639_021302 [Escallonia herrerae]|uniref:Retrotransposon gag domain-containing protein n=1 Tax=Escallonia herrerae TaxID=1293975 RepID=A0AA88V5J8_9ASTE|nr:hypothetical protein RJ639_021302 [Escallonia herrerae]